MKSSLGAVLFLAAVAAAQPLVPGPGAVEAPPVPDEPGAEFERTPEPPWEYETAVPLEEEPPEPTDPKLREVQAELDRMQDRGLARGAPSSASRSPLGLSNLLRVFSVLCVVIALILIVTLLLKKFGTRTPLFAGSSLGAVLGKIHLSPRASLHFVRTGGRVLVVGVTQNDISLVSEFDAAAFEGEIALEEGTAASAPEPWRPREETGHAAVPSAKEGERDDRFLAELKASAGDLLKDTSRPQSNEPQEAPDADIDSLRKDILRLQKYLKENLRED